MPSVGVAQLRQLHLTWYKIQVSTEACSLAAWQRVCGSLAVLSAGCMVASRTRWQGIDLPSMEASLSMTSRHTQAAQHLVVSQSPQALQDASHATLRRCESVSTYSCMLTVRSRTVGRFANEHLQTCCLTVDQCADAFPLPKRVGSAGNLVQADPQGWLIAHTYLDKNYAIVRVCHDL